MPVSSSGVVAQLLPVLHVRPCVACSLDLDACSYSITRLLMAKRLHVSSRMTLTVADSPFIQTWYMSNSCGWVTTTFESLTLGSLQMDLDNAITKALVQAAAGSDDDDGDLDSSGDEEGDAQEKPTASKGIQACTESSCQERPLAIMRQACTNPATL